MSLFILISVHFVPGISAQNTDSDWKISLTGSPAGIPVPSSFGFFALSDSRGLSAITESGQIIHQFFLDKPVSPYFTVLPSDHLFLIYEDSKQCSFFNPDGKELWHLELPFIPSIQPVYCDNGCIIVMNRLQAAGISWNGSVMWMMTFDEPWTIPPFFTSDGLLAIASSSDSYTRITFISPFGLPVNGIELAAPYIFLTEDAGIFFAVSPDGALTSFSVQYTQQNIHWKVDSAVNSQAFCLITTPSRIMTVTASGTLDTRRVSNGELLSSESLWEFSLDNLRVISSGNYTALAGDTINRTMVFLLSPAGRISWMKSLPSHNPVFFTYGGHLCQYDQDWSITAWKAPLTVNRTYPDMAVASGKYWPDIAMPETYEEMVNTLDRISERSLSFSAVTAQNIYGELGSLIHYVLKDIERSATVGWDFSPWYARIISNETDTAILKQTIAAAGNAPYDSRRQILDALEIRLKNNRSGVFNDSLCFETCKTVYKICRFMGTPAIINQGQRILSQLIQPGYETKVQQTALETVKKLMELQK